MTPEMFKSKTLSSVDLLRHQDGLKIGGFMIVCFVYDVGRAYAESGYVLNPAGREQYVAFMKRFFGAEVLTAETITRRFETDANFGLSD
jgi:hypothetical protein